MPISNKHKLCFVHIPKTAGTSVEKVLNMNQSDSLFAHAKHKLYSVTPQHLHLAEICKEMPVAETYDIFTIVRNPYDRLVSEYKHFKKNWWAREFHDVSNFDDFVYKTLNLSPEERIFKFDNHLEPQVNFLNRSDLQVEIFRFEDLSPLEAWLSEKISTQVILPHERKTQSTDYRDFYTSKHLRDFVSEFYNKDFQAFSYKK